MSLCLHGCLPECHKVGALVDSPISYKLYRFLFHSIATIACSGYKRAVKTTEQMICPSSSLDRGTLCTFPGKTAQQIQTDSPISGLPTKACVKRALFGQSVGGGRTVWLGSAMQVDFL